VTGKDILDSTKNMADLLKDVPKEKQGEFREAIIEMRTDAKMNKKGTFGSSMAMGNLSPGAAAQMTEDALTKFGSKNKDGSKKKLGDVAGEIGPEMMAEQLGISREEMMSRVKMAATLDDQREELKKGFKKQDPKTLEQLKKAGIDGNELDKVGYDQLMDTLDESTQKQLAESNKQVDYAKLQSENTKGVMDQMGVLVDFLMNQLYNVMTSIWEGITDLVDTATVGHKEERQRARLEVTIAKTKSKEMADLLSSSSSTDDFRHKAFGTAGSKDMEASIYGAAAGSQDADPKKRDAAANKYNAAIHSIDDQLGGKGLLRNQTRTDALSNASKNAGVKMSGDQMMKAQNSIFQGKDISQAMMDAGVSEADQAKILDKIRLELTPEQLALAIGNYQTKTGTNAAPGTPGGIAGPPAAPGAAPGTPAPGTPAAAGGAPTAAGAPAAPANAAAAVAATTKVVPPMNVDQGDETLNSLDSIQSVLFQKGIKINKSFLLNPFWTNGKDAVLEAMREALFEYFMYSKLDQAAVATGLKSGAFTAKNFGQKVTENAASTGQTPTVPESPPGGAGGGTVMRPRSPDSVFAAVQPGEQIVPRGGNAPGGAPSVSVSVNGPGGAELADMMRSAAINVVQQWSRKAKNT
ncbi:hypothetical protein OAA67_04320, partial [Winogradskyella sp.]|nr:hypothetical protein [Winogradskyella sp.]